MVGLGPVLFLAVFYNFGGSMYLVPAPAPGRHLEVGETLLAPRKFKC